jgi:hypothetical protein
LRGAPEARCDLVFGGSGKNLDHDAGIRIDNQAPGRRSLSGKRFQRPRHVPGSHHLGLVRELGELFFAALPARLLGAHWCRSSQTDAVGHLARPDQAPQGDQQLAGQCYDHGHACSATPIAGALPIPSHQSAVLLEDQEAPGELDHAATNPRVPRTRQSPLATP